MTGRRDPRFTMSAPSAHPSPQKKPRPSRGIRDGDLVPVRTGSRPSPHDSEELMMSTRIRDLLRPLTPSVCATQSLGVAKQVLTRARSEHIVIRDLATTPSR